jgi:integrase
MKKLPGDRVQVFGMSPDGVYVRPVFSKKRHGPAYQKMAEDYRTQLLFEKSGLVQSNIGKKSRAMREMTVLELSQKYEQEHLLHTRAQSNRAYLRIIERKWGGYRLKHINIGLVRPWVRSLIVGQEYAPSSVKKVCRYFQRIFNWGCEVELIAVNPLDHLFDTSLKKDFRRLIRAKRVVIPPCVFHRMVSYMPDYLRRACVLGWATGLRSGELCSLKWSYFQESDLIRMPADHTKETDEKYIGVDNSAQPVLDEIRAEQLIEGASEYVLSTQAGQPLKNYNVSAGFRYWVDFLGLPKYTFHDIRRSYANRKKDMGIAGKIVSRQLGHHSEATTEIHYNRDLTKNEVKSIIE